MNDRTSGYRSTYYRALNVPPLSMGMPRDYTIAFWSAVAIPVMCFPLGFWVKVILVALALAVNGVMAFIGRDNPYWIQDKRRKAQHADVYTRVAARPPAMIRRRLTP